MPCCLGVLHAGRLSSSRRTRSRAIAQAARHPVLAALAFGALLLLGAFGRAEAGSLALAWDPVASSSLRGYMVYYVQSGAGALTQPVRAPAVRVDVGNRTTYTLPNLADGVSYQIAVTAYDAQGTESRFSNIITATTPVLAPLADFEASTRTGTAPLSLNFRNESLGSITSYAWTFGDGTTSTAANPTKTYSSPGSYTVSLTVRGPAGNDTETRTGYITVSSPTTTLLSKNFNDGSLSGWRVVDEGTIDGPSSWRIVSGGLVQQSNLHGGNQDPSTLPKWGTYLVWGNGSTWTNYRARFTMRSEDDDGIGFMFRYGDADNYYRFSWDRSRGYRRLVKNVNGTFTRLASDSVQYVVGRSYQVEVVANGTTLEVWIDGARIFRVTDSARSRGTIAFYSWGQEGAHFDNLTVQ
jgi:hypothetical protein